MSETETKYTTFVTYGNNTALWTIIQELWPWVDEANAKRISAECYAIPLSPFANNKATERAYVIAKHARAEAKKLKPEN